MISKKNKAVLSIAALTWFILPPENALPQTAAPTAAVSTERWRDKPIASWTPGDALQVLERSPWAKMTVAGIARRQTEDERRAGGNMGQPTGVGYDGIDDRRVRPVLPQNVFVPAPTAPSKAQLIRLLVRWESALPVQAAELKRGEGQPPTLSDNGYSIAVYGVPFTDAKGRPRFQRVRILEAPGKKRCQTTSR